MGWQYRRFIVYAGKLRATYLDKMASPSPLGNLTNQARKAAEPEKSHYSCSFFFVSWTGLLVRTKLTDGPVQAGQNTNAMIGGLQEENQVLQIPEKTVVKRGYGIVPGKAAAHKCAYRHLNHLVVRVLRIYRYFKSNLMLCFNSIDTLINVLSKGSRTCL